MSHSPLFQIHDTSFTQLLNYEEAKVSDVLNEKPLQHSSSLDSLNTPDTASDSPDKLYRQKQLDISKAGDSPKLTYNLSVRSTIVEPSNTRTTTEEDQYCQKREIVPCTDENAFGKMCCEVVDSDDEDYSEICSSDQIINRQFTFQERRPTNIIIS